MQIMPATMYSRLLARMIAMLAGFFGVLALLPAGLGLYGVTSYAVSRRRTEIGIRMALGAEPGSVIRLVLSRVTMFVAIGVVVGAGVSVWTSKFIADAPVGFGATRSDHADWRRGRARDSRRGRRLAAGVPSVAYRSR
jgi:ABC-type antimicrobial peptide transport system permease subunit